ncbi:PAS domain-containing protein [Azoarcus sp. TTM-91]|uniref:PAS domain-containing protein n=1 Tax=Azoarcus sp. TTM-91 TaxID=2691581 RepID=UPI00145DD0FD|nr:PAS domain-containing protein [Azoarcus sp. TTM-91]NMG36229.1 PAS domain-containing protein [Azoarcus sp. TTM-91]
MSDAPLPPLPPSPSPGLLALPATLIYAAFAVAWIIYSDQVISLWVSEPARLTELQTYKGLFFVLVTSVLLWILVRLGFARLTQLQQGLLRREARLRLAIRATGLGLWDYRVDGDVVEHDESVARMVGAAPEAFSESAEAWLERVHPEDRERVRERFRAYLGGRVATYQCEFRLRLAGDIYRWFSSVGQVVERDGEGHALRVVGTYLDISDRHPQSPAGAMTQRV